MSATQNQNLVTALDNSNVAAARQALAQGADVDGVYEGHGTMLLGAAYNGSLDILDALLEFGANPLASSFDEQNVYHKICQAMALEDYDRAAMVRRMQYVGPNPDDPDRHGFAAMHYAGLNDLSAVVHSLNVNCDADVNVSDRQGNTPTHMAAVRGNSDTVYALLLLGGDAQIENDQGDTPASLAAQRQQGDVMHAIARYEAFDEVDPAHASADEKTLHNPKFWKQAEQALAAMEARGEHVTLQTLNTSDEQGSSPLNLAYLCGKLDVVFAHVRNHEQISAQDLQTQEGKPTALTSLMVRAGTCGDLFTKDQWQGRDVSQLAEAYNALPQEGQAQVKNYQRLKQFVQRENTQNNAVSR